MEHVLFWIRVVVVATVLTAASRADAMCAPQFWVGTPEGSPIPTRGALYVYSNAHADGGRVPLTVQWIGPQGTAEQSRISDDVIKVSYQGDAGSELLVGAGHRTARYALVNTWRSPTIAPTARSFVHVTSIINCSPPDLLQVTLDQPTAAIRLRWTFGASTSEWVIPAEEDIVEIGKIGCGGTTVPPDQLAIGGHLELIAIRLDGSEVMVRGVPNRISFGDVPTHDGRDEILTVLREPVQAPRELPPLSYDGLVLALALVLLVAGAGFARLWLRTELARLR